MKRAGIGTASAAALIAVIAALVVGLAFTGAFGPSVSGGLSDFKKGLGFIQSETSEVQVASSNLLADTFEGSQALPPTCGATSLNSYIKLTNSGGSSDSVSSITITYGGESNDFEVSGACTVGPATSPSGTLYVLFPGPSDLPNSPTPAAGEPFQGTVNLAGGATLPFSGDFEQGYPTVFASGEALMASQLAKGNASVSCQSSPPTNSSYIELSNNGTEGASVSQVGLDWNGTSLTYLVTVPCEIGPQGTGSASLFVLLGGLNPVASEPAAGQQYSATVVLRNGAQGLQVQCSGVFR